VSGKEIKAEKIFLVSGARPLIPSIKGLDTVPYLTNENVVSLQEKPKSMIIIGGGYIAVEFAHFFSAVGTIVTIFQRGNRLIPNAEPEISELLKKQLAKRMQIILNTEVIQVQKQGDELVVQGIDSVSGEEISVSAEKIAMEKEGERILAAVSSGSFVIALDPKGTSWSSMELAKFLRQRELAGKTS
jgi:dihydrolipoamide dehydrogenase